MGYDEWMTPPATIEKANLFFEHITGRGIDIDAASNAVAQEYVKAGRYFTAENSALAPEVKWNGNVWLNPPYSRGLITNFAERAVDEYYNGNASNMLVLVNSETDTGWYHILLDGCQALLLYKGRLKFWKVYDGKAWEKWPSMKTGKIGNQPQYNNSLFYFGSKTFDFIKIYSNDGTVLIPV